MSSAEDKRLIDGLGLTRREERTLRYIAGLEKPEPTGRIGRFSQRPLKGLAGALAVGTVLIVAASVAYIIVRNSDYISAHIMPWLSAIMPLFILSLLFVDLVVYRRLVRKLYQFLARERVSTLNAGQPGHQADA